MDNPYWGKADNSCSHVKLQYNNCHCWEQSLQDHYKILMTDCQFWTRDITLPNQIVTWTKNEDNQYTIATYLYPEFQFKMSLNEWDNERKLFEVF